MADLHFLCPSCRHSLIVDESGAGLETECAHCAAPVRIPDPDAESVEHEERVLCAHLKGEEERLNDALAAALARIAELEEAPAPAADGPGKEEFARLERQLAGTARDLEAAVKSANAAAAKLSAAEAKNTELASAAVRHEEEAAKLRASLETSTREHGAHAKERAKLEKQIKSLGEAGDAARKSEKAAAGKIEAGAKECEKLRAELDELRVVSGERGKELEAARAELEAARETAASETTNLRNQLENAMTELSDAHAEILNLKRERDRVTAEFRDLEAKLAAAEEEATGLRAELENRPAGGGDSDAEVEKLRQALETAAAGQRALKQQLEETAVSLGGLSEKLRESRAAEEALRAQIAGDSERIARLQEEVASAESARAPLNDGEFEATRKSMEAAAAELEELRASKTTLSERVGKMETQLSQAQREAATFAGEAHDLKSRLRVGEAALTAANDKLAQVGHSDSEHTAQLREMRDQLAALQTKHAEGMHALEAERAKVRALAADLEAAGNGTPGTAMASRSAAELDALQVKMTALISELNDAREELMDSKETLRKLDRALYAATTERDCFETMLNSLKTNFSDVSGRLAAFESWADANDMWSELEASIPAPNNGKA